MTDDRDSRPHPVGAHGGAPASEGDESAIGNRSAIEPGRTAVRPYTSLSDRLSREVIAELLLAAGVVAFGGLVVYQTTQIRVVPLYAKVGPRVIPYVVGAGLVALGLWLAGEALTGRTAGPSEESEDVDPTLPTDWLTVGLIATALVVYLLLIERAGFIIASALLFFGAAVAMGNRRYARDAVISLLLSVAVFYIFTDGLNLRLPEGWLEVLP